MKLHYPKILLFFIPLNILITSSNAHNKNKIYIKSHTPTTTSRVLSECDLYLPNYDNDADMKSVKDNFDRQTSQRFEEYNERMNRKRQKYKEQCDKDIQQIIEKDKRQKSLVEKVEKGCLMCACGLGGGVAPVWSLVSGLWYGTWINYTNTTLVKIATDTGIAEGVKVGLVKVKEIATEALGSTVSIPELKVGEIITAGKFTDGVSLDGIFKAMDTFMVGKFDEGACGQFSMWVQKLAKSPGSYTVKYSAKVTEVTNAFSDAKTGILTKAGNATSSLSTAITASIITIVVIVLVMVIIYLILRYRRKKKTNKKLQYTKLLNE
ncbi:PIR protein, putative [Plasmodium sp. gorilla clade G1]|nr:PIR protein, putative [Plasmodium sp. gorilla clade G1]